VAPLFVMARMVSRSAGGHAQLVVFEPGQTEPRVLVAANGLSNAEHPQMSPDGRSVAFAWTRDNVNVSKSVFDIYVMGIDGSNVRRVTRANPVSANGNDFPSWSPDGQRLAYASPDVNNVASIWTTRLNGGDQRKLPGTEGGFGPAWSPDGSRIAFIDSIDGKFRVRLVDLATSRVSTLVEGISFLSLPSWSPDGTRLLYSRTDRNAVVLLDVATRVERALPLGQGAPAFVRFCGGADQLLVRFGRVEESGTAADHLVLIGTDGSRPRTLLTAPSLHTFNPFSCAS
jgi:Tol biopolymer transport system component